MTSICNDDTPTVWPVQMAPIKLYRGANWGRDADYSWVQLKQGLALQRWQGFDKSICFRIRGQVFFLRGFISSYLYWLHLDYCSTEEGWEQMKGDYKYHPGRLSIATCPVITRNFSGPPTISRGLIGQPRTFICIQASYPMPPLAFFPSVKSFHLHRHHWHNIWIVNVHCIGTLPKCASWPSLPIPCLFFA